MNELDRTRIRCVFDTAEIDIEGPAVQAESSFGAFLCAVANKHRTPSGDEITNEQPQPLRVGSIASSVLEEMGFDRRDVSRAMLAASDCENKASARGKTMRTKRFAPAPTSPPMPTPAARNGHASDDEDLLDLDQVRSMIDSGDRSSEGVVELCERLSTFGWTVLDADLWCLTEDGHREWAAFRERLAPNTKQLTGTVTEASS